MWSGNRPIPAVAVSTRASIGRWRATEAAISPENGARCGALHTVCTPFWPTLRGGPLLPGRPTVLSGPLGEPGCTSRRHRVTAGRLFSRSIGTIGGAQPGRAGATHSAGRYTATALYGAETREACRSGPTTWGTRRVDHAVWVRTRVRQPPARAPWIGLRHLRGGGVPPVQARAAPVMGAPPRSRDPQKTMTSEIGRRSDEPQGDGCSQSPRGGAVPVWIGV